MKTLICLFVACISLNSASAQCFPVMKQQSPQNGYTDQKSFASGKNLFFTVSEIDTAGKKKVVYHVFENGSWYNLAPMYVPWANGTLVRWDNRILAVCSHPSFNGINAPSGKNFGFLQYVNGQWDTLQGGLIDAAGQSVAAECTAKELWKSVHKVLGQAEIYKYDVSAGKFIHKFSVAGSYVIHMHGGKDRLLITNITTIDTSSTVNFAYIENDTIHLNSDTAFHGRPGGGMVMYGIDPATDDIVAFPWQDNPHVIRLQKNGTKTRTQTTLKLPGMGGMSSAVRIELADDKIVWMTSYYERHMNVLCDGETEWSVISGPVMEWWMVIGYKGKIYGLNGNDHLTYVLENGALLKGRVFVDLNSNCTYNSGDAVVKQQPLTLKHLPNGLKSFSMTDDQGIYKAFIEKDTYLVKAVGPLDTACMDDTLYITADSNTRDVRLAKPNHYNVKIEILNPGRMRWNSRQWLIFKVTNTGEPMDSVRFRFRWKGGLRLDSSNLAGDEIDDTMLTGTLYNLGYYESLLVRAYGRIDTALNAVGDTIEAVCQVESFNTEVDYSDNTEKIKFRIVYSMDPNHKEVKQELIPVNATKRLDYFIEFQNEGSDDAYDVEIRDTLDLRFAAQELTINASSHPYTASLKGNALSFTFRDIFLKPKSQDEAASKGFISFSIFVNGMEDGDSVRNRAAIFFDLNKPVITNYAVTKASSSVVSIPEKVNVKDKLAVYPNPANGMLHISSGGIREVVNIYNLQGALVYSGTLEGGQAVVDVSSLANGLYLLLVGDACLKFVKGE